MIFQINYNTNQFDDYIIRNKHITDKLNYKLFDTYECDYFLKHYNYYDKFYSLKVIESEKWQETAIKCDYLRLLILYELGGIYIDVDVILYDMMFDLEHFLKKKFNDSNVVAENRTLCFIKGIQRSKYIKSLLNIYNYTNELTYDIKSFPIKKFFNFKLGVRIIQQSTLDKYFYYIPHGEQK